MRLNLRYFDYCFLGCNTLFLVEWHWILEELALYPDDGVFLLHRGDEGNTFFWNEVNCITDMRNSRFISLVFVTGTAWTAWGSNSGGGEILHTRTARPWAHQASCKKGYCISLPRVRRTERGVDTVLPYGAEVKKVEVYLYSPGPLAQITLLRMFIIWHLVSTSSVGHHKAIVQEQETTPEVETSCQIKTFAKEWVVCGWKLRYAFECYTNSDVSYKDCHYFVVGDVDWQNVLTVNVQVQMFAGACCVHLHGSPCPVPS